MGAVPQHPFFLRVIDSLQSFDRSWYLPYITIMYSTGPLFLSVIWKEYMRAGPTEAHRVRVLMPDDYSKHASSFFKVYRGSSWHGNDAQLIFWVCISFPIRTNPRGIFADNNLQMGRHWLLLTLTGVTLASLIGTGSWWLYRRARFSAGRKGHVGARPFFSRWRSRGRKDGYELVTRDHHV